jgi:hypothetical protein
LIEKVYGGLLGLVVFVNNRIAPLLEPQVALDVRMESISWRMEEILIAVLILSLQPAGLDTINL